MTRPSPTHRRPPAEHAIGPALARGLLADQHPDLADLEIRLAAHGWDNVTFRLGEDLALRLPRRAVAAELLATEQRWLPGLARNLPIATPAPLRIGAPGRGYPWGWSVVPWLPGLPAERAPLKADQAPRLGAFLKALHREAPAAAPFNPYRSVGLIERGRITDPTLERVAALRPEVIDQTVRRTWAEAVATEVDIAPTWIHGDLHARNLLSDQGVISGVIDWGDMARGDPAMDLYSLWMLLPDAHARAAALQACGGISAATLRRARGWAVAMGVVLMEAGMADDPGLAAMGERTLKALGEGP